MASAWLFSLNDNPDSTWGTYEGLNHAIRSSRLRNGQFELNSEVWGRFAGMKPPKPGDGIGFYFSTRGKAPRGPGVYAFGTIRDIAVDERSVTDLAVEIDERLLNQLGEEPLLRRENRALFERAGIVRGPVYSFYPVEHRTWAELAALASRSTRMKDGRLRRVAKDLPPFKPETLEDGRRRIELAIVQRQGQPAFRRDLMENYGGACAMTGSRIEVVLEAAHIVPYRGPGTNRLDNGLLLRSDIHTLFDLGLIAVNPVGNRIVVAKSLLKTEYGALHGRRLRKPMKGRMAPAPKALAWQFSQAALD